MKVIFYDFRFNCKSANERDLKLLALIYISISLFRSPLLYLSRRH